MLVQKAIVHGTVGRVRQSGMARLTLCSTSPSLWFIPPEGERTITSFGEEPNTIAGNFPPCTGVSMYDTR
jgi:hypothetical protein